MQHLMIAVAAGGGGFNPLDLAGGGNVLWTLVIFAASVGFMWKVVMGPVTKALVERDDIAARAIQQAERAKDEAEKARAEVEVALGNAQAEAAQLLSDARERATVREHEIVEAAKQEASAMVEGARSAIRAEQEKAISAIRNEVVDLSLHAASRVLGRSCDSEDDRRLVGEVVGGPAVADN